MNTKDKLKATKTLKTTTIDLISKKTTLHVQHTFFFLISKKQLCTCSSFFCTFPYRCFTGLKREISFSLLFTRFMEEVFVFLLCFFTAAPFSH